VPKETKKVNGEEQWVEGEDGDEFYADWNSKWEAMQQKCDAIIAKGARWTDPEFNGASSLWKSSAEKNGNDICDKARESWKDGVWKRAG